MGGVLPAKMMVMCFASGSKTCESEVCNVPVMSFSTSARKTSMDAYLLLLDKHVVRSIGQADQRAGCNAPDQSVFTCRTASPRPKRCRHLMGPKAGGSQSRNMQNKCGGEWSQIEPSQWKKAYSRAKKRCWKKEMSHRMAFAKNQNMSNYIFLGI